MSSLESQDLYKCGIRRKRLSAEMGFLTEIDILNGNREINSTNSSAKNSVPRNETTPTHNHRSRDVVNPICWDQYAASRTVWRKNAPKTYSHPANLQPRACKRQRISSDLKEYLIHDKTDTAMARELRQFLDMANVSIFGIDINGNINEWNEKTAMITGYSREEALNKPLVTTFISSELRKSVQNILDRALMEDETSNYELEFRTKANEIRHLLVNVTTRRDTESNIVGVVGVAQDVTESSKHDRAAKSVAQELRQLINTANAPIFGIDVNGNVNEWNDKFAEITGFTKEETLNKPLVSTFIVSELHQSVQDVLDRALKGDESSN